METIVGYVSCCGVGIMFSLFNLQCYVTPPAIKNKELSFCAAFPLGMRPISGNLDRTSLANKGFIKAKRYVFFWQNQYRKSPAGRVAGHLASLGSQSENKIHFILSA